LFAEVDDAEARAMLAFLRWWESRRTDPYPEIKQWIEHIAAASNFVFRLSGKPAYIHENPVIIGVWEKCFSRGVSDYSAQCLITGEIVPIAKVHQSIKGVAGAKSTGSAIVSFNIPSFLSYGKEQSYNAPIGQTAMLKYTTALNYLLSGENKIRIGDTTIVYWAEQISPKEEIFLQFMLNPRMTHAETESEPSIMSEDDLVQEIGGVLEAVRDGRHVADPLEKLGLDPNLTFNILGLAPNASRLSIRFWFVDHFGSLIEKIAEHYADMDIERPPKAFKYVPTWALLKEMAAPGKEQKVPNSLISSLNYAILNGTGYPYAMLSAMLGRIRADKSINYQRAGFIKAFLIRRDNKKEVFTVSLNLENKTPAYLLGRLFSLLEKAQIEAHNEKLNRTIRDRYFGAASATPAIVFPQLLRLVQHHISKSNYGGAIDKKIQAVLDDLPAFPKHLSLEEQGSFFLGYYQQKQATYKGDNGN
jgi:CRISPR-associated protein Csd1